MKLFSNNTIPCEQRNFFPRWISNGAIAVFFVVMVLLCVIFPLQIIPVRLWLFDIISVVVFFVGCNVISLRWKQISTPLFGRYLFWWSLLIRVVFVVFVYFYNWKIYNNYWGAGTTDVTFYVPAALQSAHRNGLNLIACYKELISWHVQSADTGYLMYLSIIYVITGKISEVIIPLLLKALMGAATCKLVFEIARIEFGVEVGKISAVMCMLCPSLIWWCGSMMKETEMIFLTVLFVYYSERLIRKKTYGFRNICPVLLVGASLFLFRTALGIVVFLALFVALLFTSSRVIGWKRRISVALILVGLVGAMAQNRISEEVAEMTQRAPSAQKADMEWRTQRSHGNSFAKYAGAAVFAPLIFTIPFPTLSYTYFEQEQIMQNAGGNYVKNIMSFFVVWVLFVLLFSGEWRKHVLPIALLVGYLLVLVFSNFAQSGRFHMPALPFEMMFAAYCISIFRRTDKKWYYCALALEAVLCIGWQWFKLKGQGLL